MDKIIWGIKGQEVSAASDRGHSDIRNKGLVVPPLFRKRPILCSPDHQRWHVDSLVFKSCTLPA